MATPWRPRLAVVIGRAWEEFAAHRSAVTGRPTTIGTCSTCECGRVGTVSMIRRPDMTGLLVGWIAPSATSFVTGERAPNANPVVQADCRHVPESWFGLGVARGDRAKFWRRPPGPTTDTSCRRAGLASSLGQRTRFRPGSGRCLRSPHRERLTDEPAWWPPQAVR